MKEEILQRGQLQGWSASYIYCAKADRTKRDVQQNGTEGTLERFQKKKGVRSMAVNNGGFATQ